MKFAKFLEICSIIFNLRKFTISQISSHYKIDYNTVKQTVEILAKNKLVKRINGSWVVR